MTINKKVLPLKFFLSFGFIFLSLFIIVYADIFPKEEDKIAINPSFVWYDDGMSSDISMDNVEINVDDNTNAWVLQYVVQPGDSLWKIASMFWTTVSNIQKVNKLTWPIRWGQKLMITEDDQWFLYTIPENINVMIFTNKYKLNAEEFMTLNYVQDKSEILYKGQDVFLNISNNQAYDVWLIAKPTPSIVIKPTNPYKPVINKPVARNKPIANQQFITEESDTTNDTTDTTPVQKSKVISQWVFKKDVKNSFYPGYCTWYAAIISPEIFPYTSENKQEREFGGNAREWCENAKKAWFRVGNKPAVGALIVYQKGWRLTYAGHVGKVINYSRW